MWERSAPAIVWILRGGGGMFSEVWLPLPPFFSPFYNATPEKHFLNNEEQFQWKESNSETSDLISNFKKYVMKLQYELFPEHKYVLKNTAHLILIF